MRPLSWEGRPGGREARRECPNGFSLTTARADGKPGSPHCGSYPARRPGASWRSGSAFLHPPLPPGKGSRGLHVLVAVRRERTRVSRAAANPLRNGEARSRPRAPAPTVPTTSSPSSSARKEQPCAMPLSRPSRYSSRPSSARRPPPTRGSRTSSTSTPTTTARTACAALGNPMLQTPNLDALVERGMAFTHCYTDGLDGRRGLHAEPHHDAHRPVVAAHPEGPRRGPQRRRPRDVPAAGHGRGRVSDVPHGEEGQRLPGGPPGVPDQRRSTTPTGTRRTTTAPIAAGGWPTAPSRS